MKRAFLFRPSAVLLLFYLAGFLYSAEVPVMAPVFVPIKSSAPLRTFAASVDDSPTFAIVFTVKAPDGLPFVGPVCTVMSDMLGSESRRHTREQVRTELARFGLRLSKTADERHISLLLRGPSENLAAGLDLMADLALGASFSPDAVTRMAARVTWDDELILNDPVALLRCAAAVSDSATLRAPDPAGQLAALLDVRREHVLSLYRSTFVPANSSLLVIGASPSAATKKALKESFGMWPRTAVFGSADSTILESREPVILMNRPGSKRVVGLMLVDHPPVRSPDFLCDLLLGRLKSRFPCTEVSDSGQLRLLAVETLRTADGDDLGVFFVCEPDHLGSDVPALRDSWPELVGRSISPQEWSAALTAERGRLQIKLSSVEGTAALATEGLVEFGNPLATVKAYEAGASLLPEQSATQLSGLERCRIRFILLADSSLLSSTFREVKKSWK